MKKEHIAALMMAALVAAGATTFSAEAAEPLPGNGVYEGLDCRISERPTVRNYRTLGSVSDKNVWNYTRPSVTVGEKALSVKGLIINGQAYIPFRMAANAVGATYTYNSSTKTSVMKANGLYMNASDGCYTVYANDRALFAENPVVIMNDGRMYIPASTFAKAVGMDLKVSSEKINISGGFSPLSHASSFYREDEVFWLARIIHAESRGEPLFGKIAVGDVVLNRVRSSAYPNTIYGVIFDRKYGVQFSPILDGSIYNTPDFNSILAAKICLDSYNISQDVLFFLEPSHSTSSWIPKNREYIFTIGKHDFYR